MPPWAPLKVLKIQEKQNQQKIRWRNAQCNRKTIDKIDYSDNYSEDDLGSLEKDEEMDFNVMPVLDSELLLITESIKTLRTNMVN